MHIRPIALWLGLAATPDFALAAHAQYAVTVLQAPSGSVASEIYAINASGQTVGGTNGSVQDAVLWSPTGTTVLQDVGGEGRSGVTAINASGQVAGASGIDAGDGQEAVLWAP